MLQRSICDKLMSKFLEFLSALLRLTAVNNKPRYFVVTRAHLCKKGLPENSYCAIEWTDKSRKFKFKIRYKQNVAAY